MKTKKLGKSCYATGRCYAVVGNDGSRWIGNGRALWLVTSAVGMDEDMMRMLLDLDGKKGDKMIYALRTMDESAAEGASAAYMMDGVDVPAELVMELPFDSGDEDGIILLDDGSGIVAVYALDVAPVRDCCPTYSIVRNAEGQRFVRLLWGMQCVGIVQPISDIMTGAILRRLADVAEKGATKSGARDGFDLFGEETR